MRSRSTSYTGSDASEESLSPLFSEDRPVHVSDIVGGLTVSIEPAVAPRSEPRYKAALRRFDWYDFGVIVLLMVSGIASLICLIHG